MNDRDGIDPLDKPIWGAKKIGQIVNRDEPETFYLLGRGLLDADKKESSGPRRRAACCAGFKAITLNRKARR